MPTIGFIMAFVGASVALLIGILIFSEVSDALECPMIDGVELAECKQAKETAWTVIGILPIALFFALFAIFGALGDGGSILSGLIPHKPKIPTNRISHLGSQVAGQSKSKILLVMKILGLTRKQRND